MSEKSYPALAADLYTGGRADGAREGSERMRADAVKEIRRRAHLAYMEPKLYTAEEALILAAEAVADIPLDGSVVPVDSGRASRIEAALRDEAIPFLAGYCESADDDDPAHLHLKRWRAALARSKQSSSPAVAPEATT